MTKNEIRRCPDCLMSENFPGVVYGNTGLCRLCENYDPDKEARIAETNRKKIEAVILEKKGKGMYDALVSYSGGKDSSYTLCHLKEKYDLNILALLVDNCFLSKQAFENARTLTDRLGTDLMIFRPDPGFMLKLFCVSAEGELYDLSRLTRANAICLSCIGMITSIAFSEAVMRGIPIIAGGYVSGQMPSSGGVLRTDGGMFGMFGEQNRKDREHLVSHTDERANRYFRIPVPLDRAGYPVIINPMLGLELSEAHIEEAVSAYGWVRPVDTGMSSSNCLMNDYAVALHYRKYGYHSYESEICTQVRKGLLSKDAALDKLNDIRSPDMFAQIISKLKG